MFTQIIRKTFLPFQTPFVIFNMSTIFNGHQSHCSQCAWISFLGEKFFFRYFFLKTVLIILQCCWIIFLFDKLKNNSWRPFLINRWESCLWAQIRKNYRRMRSLVSQPKSTLIYSFGTRAALWFHFDFYFWVVFILIRAISQRFSNITSSNHNPWILLQTIRTIVIKETAAISVFFFSLRLNVLFPWIGLVCSDVGDNRFQTDSLRFCLAFWFIVGKASQVVFRHRTN